MLRLLEAKKDLPKSYVIVIYIPVVPCSRPKEMQAFVNRAITIDVATISGKGVQKACESEVAPRFQGLGFRV